VINTASVTEDPASYNYKNNVSLRYGFGGGSPVYPWATTNGSFDMSFDLKVPTATFVSGTVPHVYASIAVIDPNGQSISIQPNMYDPRGALTEFSGWDPVGNAAYVHSSFTSNAKFISMLPGSSTIATTTWNDWRYFGFSITDDELLAIINKINHDWHAGLSTNVSGYRVASMSLQSEVSWPTGNAVLATGINNVNMWITPEPGTLILLLCGLPGLALFAWRRRRRS
jgi:hypothetical protein